VKEKVFQMPWGGYPKGVAHRWCFRWTDGLADWVECVEIPGLIVAHFLEPFSLFDALYHQQTINCEIRKETPEGGYLRAVEGKELRHALGE